MFLNLRLRFLSFHEFCWSWLVLAITYLKLPAINKLENATKWIKRGEGEECRNNLIEGHIFV